MMTVWSKSKSLVFCDINIKQNSRNARGAFKNEKAKKRKPSCWQKIAAPSRTQGCTVVGAALPRSRNDRFGSAPKLHNIPTAQPTA